MGRSKTVRVNVMLTEEIVFLVRGAIAGGRYSGGASEYVRALIVAERLCSGDRRAEGVETKIPVGRQRMA